MPGKAGQFAKKWHGVHKNDTQLLKGNAAVFDLR
jgi:hypothetical protein